MKSIFGKNNDIKVYARKCIIKEIKSKERNVFLNKTHIQGEDKANISLGLFYNNELVAVLSLCKPRINLGRKTQNNGEFELSRYSSLLGYSIIGGFSKLLKYAIKNYNIELLYTYADFRWTGRNNNVYTKNNFIYQSLSSPNYYYLISGMKRENRFKYRKNELKKKFPNLYSDEKSEKQIMEEAGYYRIYDCGSIKYQLNLDFIKEIKEK